MDCGAEFHGYTADITRTFPINGTFTSEQKILYDVVLEAQDSAIAQCQVGNVWRSTHIAARSVIKKRLFELGIIRDTLQFPTDYRYYFMHGTSHHLGLDVHDLGRGDVPFRPGMVLTVEPGVYIPAGSPCDQKWWDIGIRIEDDIVIVSEDEADELGNTYRNMSAKLARTTQDIERLMSDKD
jgi:Xaa-Pro aminopeptidase